ncbi:MAG: peptidylprolyl isomerase [Parvibaculum sp.]|uniref:peptidylprolyl isomerase n=1 Tax=Parvibaculum sp. TaxID=2024848 RepID=UPI0032EB7991
MRGLKGALVALVAVIGLAGTAFAADPENTIYLDLKDGRVVIELLPEVAPQHVERIKTLARDGFYDGIVFHRVIPGFMAQTGDPTGTGMGGSMLDDVKAEFSKTESFTRGAVGMARSQSPDSANSQFFIMFDAGEFLNGQYTVVGRVTDGMEVVDAIKRGKGPNGAVIGQPDVMTRVTVTD